jgi:hypothetical protein
MFTSLRWVMENSRRDYVFGRVLANRVLQNVVFSVDVVTMSQVLSKLRIST